MIPIRLQLKNFMSYGEGVPPLDFTGMRIACLSGDNGSGKTTLLDALTWALWGETRAPSEDDVIRLGASECRVLFDFEVEHTRYRVHRARSRRGGSVWELQVWQEDGTTRSLSGTNARETKQRLEQLLRMDYKTFLASAYLAQGRADEFTRAPVAERKKVLADILDLGRYEQLEALAKEKRAEAEARELDAIREIQAIDSELAHEDEYLGALQAAETILATVVEQLGELHTQQEQLAAQEQRLSEREEKAREYQARIAEVEEETVHTNQMLRETAQRLDGAQQILARRREIETAHAAFCQLRERIGPLEAQYGSLLELEREVHALDATIRGEHDDLDRERYRLACDVESLEKEQREIPRWEAEVARLDAQIADHIDPQSGQDPKQRRAQAEQRRADADDALVKRKAEHEALRNEIERLERRCQALASSNESLCDYCGQPLSPAKREQAQVEAQAEQVSLEARLRACLAKGKEAKRESDHWVGEAKRAQADLDALAKIELRRAHATQEQLRLEERCKTLPDLHRRLTGFERRLGERDFAHDAQERRLRVSAQLEKLERVAQELALARTQEQQLAGAVREFAQLESAHTTVVLEEQRAGEYRALIEKRQAQVAKAEAMIVKIRQETEALPRLRQGLADLAAALLAARTRERDALREINQKTLLLEHGAKLKGERVRRTEEQQTAAKQKDVYKELVGAFGKRGVQALIIENALPEIQDVANQILGRMTDGGMQVQLLAQREAKTKNTSAIETLDIILSDDMGTRPYEMYSGGEAFRVNFALRVALSKMLAHRAGAPLQTLMLDEGFGTQDPRGRESILDAINTVADDFALILVITHIEELRDQFPTRIEVVKGPDGSSFTVA